MMSAGPVPESAAALLIRGQINHNKLLSAFLVLAVIPRPAVVVLDWAGCNALTAGTGARAVMA